MSQHKEKLTRKEKFAQQRGETQKLKQHTVIAESGRKQRLLPGLILALIAFLLYANSLPHEFVLDDSNAVTENHIVKQGIKGIPQLLVTDYRAGYWTAKGTLYRPLSLVMMAIEWELFPNNPFPGHLINVLLYSLTVCLLFLLLCRLMSGMSLLLPFLTALLFTVHPIHTEVVANIKSRDEILSFLFVVGALHLLLNYLKNERIFMLVIASVLYFLSFMSKESSITILAVVPVMTYFFLGRASPATVNSSLILILKVTAFFAAGAGAYLILRKMVLGEITDIPDVMLIDNFLIAADSFGTKTATAMKILGKYLGLLFFPHPLSIDYAYNEIPIVNWSDWRALVSLAVYLGLVVIVMLRFNKKEWWVFGIIFYLITISLYSNLVITIGSGFGERFLYVPSLGFCITVTGLLALLFKSDVKQSGKNIVQMLSENKAIVAIVFLLAAAGSVKTVARSAVWNNHFLIYSTDVKHAPNSARLHYWYANEFMKVKAMKAPTAEEKKKLLDVSIREYNKALEIFPDYADAFGQRGLAYYRKGEADSAIADYKRAIDLRVGQWKVYNNAGVIYGERNDLNEALKYFKLALKVDSRFPDPYKNIGGVYLMQGDIDTAIRYYMEALKYTTVADKETIAEIYAYLAMCYEKKGDIANQQKYAALARKERNP